MPEIDVAKAFTLTHENGAKTPFTAGKQDVSGDIANHWFVKAHLVGAKPNPAAGSPMHLRAAEEKRRELEAERLKREREDNDKVEAHVRERLEAEMQERIKLAIEKNARDAAAGVDTEVGKRVAEIEARLTADFDGRVKDAAEAAVLAHMEAEEKAKAEAGDKPGEDSKGEKADGKGKGGK